MVNKPASSLVVPLEKALHEFSSSWSGKQMVGKLQGKSAAGDSKLMQCPTFVAVLPMC